MGAPRFESGPLSVSMMRVARRAQMARVLPPHAIQAAWFSAVCDPAALARAWVCKDDASNGCRVASLARRKRSSYVAIVVIESAWGPLGNEAEPAIHIAAMQGITSIVLIAARPVHSATVWTPVAAIVVVRPVRRIAIGDKVGPLHEEIDRCGDSGEVVLNRPDSVLEKIIVRYLDGAEEGRSLQLCTVSFPQFGEHLP